MGFPLPVGAWCAGPWRDLVRDTCLSPRARGRGMIDPLAVERALERPDRFGRGLYAALFLELWCRTFLDAS
jgi:hypothetical protein